MTEWLVIARCVNSEGMSVWVPLRYMANTLGGAAEKAMAALERWDRVEELQVVRWDLIDRYEPVSPRPWQVKALDS